MLHHFTDRNCSVVVGMVLSKFLLWLLLFSASTAIAGGEAQVKVKEVLTIAGNFSLNGKFTNLAQFDVSSGVWTDNYEPELYVYGESNGVLWDTKVNRSTHSDPTGELLDELLVVGAFDTVSSTSQVLYCSVGIWTGLTFNKVGEGLCPRGGGSSSGMIIQTSTFGSNGDIFVGGRFQSRVWDVNMFTDVHNIAHYQKSSSSWLPLEGGKLNCRQEISCISRVNALEWDEDSQTLFIGGKFNYLDDVPIASGLCIWSEVTGIIPFSNDSDGGLSLSGATGRDGEATVLKYDGLSKSLFVAGSFSFVSGLVCSSVAVWHRPTNLWTCLDNSRFSISTVTAMLLDPLKQLLYLAGWASFQAKWPGRNWGSPYAITRIDVRDYIEKKSQLNAELEKYCGGRSGQKDICTQNHRLLSRVSMRGRSNHSRALKKMTFKFSWSWLPGFSGGNGPIFGIVPGIHQFKSCLFIAGAFNNGPPIVLWAPPGFISSKSSRFRHLTSGGGSNCLFQPCVYPIGSNNSIYGLITSVAQLKVPTSTAVFDDDVPVTPSDPTSMLPSATLYVLLLLSVTGGILLGVSITFRCMKGDYERIPSMGEDDEEDEEESSGGRRRGQSFMLGTLLAGGNRSIDLRACFNRAMAARNLSTDEMFALIDPNEVELVTTIGEGTFGTVWNGFWKNNAVAVKEFGFAKAAICGGSQQSESLVEEIVGEAGLMTCLHHPKILQLYGCSLTPQAVWLVCELCERGSLRNLLADRSTALCDKQKLSLCMDIADAMLYLHRRSKPIIHRDLKSYNVFVIETSSKKFVAKIGDWGSARAIAMSGSSSMTQGVGTACWLAPEAIRQSHFSKASDVYSYGIVLWEVYTRSRVHPTLTDSQIIARVANDGLRPPVSFLCPWGDLMQHCWAERPYNRPNFAAIVSSLHRIYNGEEDGRRVGTVTAHNLSRHNEILQNRVRNYHKEEGDDSSCESREIGASF